jgi:hypothetical protein
MREIDMTLFFKILKLFSLPLIGIALAVFYTGIAATPAHACSSPTATQLFCSAGGTAPPGFGTTFQNNLIDPLGSQCTAGGPGCGDTFVDVGVGECTDGSTGCNAGGDLLLPVSNDPCISCFAEPGQVGSLTGNDDQSLQPVRDYLGDQRKILDFQTEALNRSNAIAENTTEALRENAGAISESREQVKTLEDRIEVLRGDNNNEEWGTVEEDLRAAKNKLDGLETERDRLTGVRELADKNVDVQAGLVSSTQENIDRAEETGQVPETPGGFLTQFGGGGEGTQTAYRQRGGENSSFNKAVEGGKGYTFEPDLNRARGVDTFFDGTVGSQFIRSTSGHATTGENLSAGTLAGAELWDKPFLITYVYMQAGLERKLADAVRRGDVPGTIEVVRGEDGVTKEVVTIPPEGLEAAKPYLDAQDSLFEGVIEEDGNTTSDEEQRRADERRERDNEEYQREREAQQRQRAREQRANPVPAKDVQDNIDPDGFLSVIDEVQGIIPLV